MRRHISSLAAVALGVVLFAAAAGCAPVSGRLYVRTGPPVRVVEVRSVAPGPGFVWIEGYHRWDGRGYLWVPGRWERAPRARAAWVPGHWAQDRRGWYWVDGRWR
jgi:hypothetical protein